MTGKLALTRLSSEGRVVIPRSVISDLQLEAGAQFAVFGRGDTVLLKQIKQPQQEDFSTIRAKIRKQAKKAGMKKSDVTAAIKAVRQGK